jgi:hypothetical protein
VPRQPCSLRHRSASPSGRAAFGCKRCGCAPCLAIPPRSAASRMRVGIGGFCHRATGWARLGRLSGKRDPSEWTWGAGCVIGDICGSTVLPRAPAVCLRGISANRRLDHFPARRCGTGPHHRSAIRCSPGWEDPGRVETRQGLEFHRDPPASPSRPARPRRWSQGRITARGRPGRVTPPDAGSEAVGRTPCPADQAQETSAGGNNDRHYGCWRRTPAIQMRYGSRVCRRKSDPALSL